jgi:hypothetical protein
VVEDVVVVVEDALLGSIEAGVVSAGIELSGVCEEVWLIPPRPGIVEETHGLKYINAATEPTIRSIRSTIESTRSHRRLRFILTGAVENSDCATIGCTVGCGGRPLPGG